MADKSDDHAEPRVIKRALELITEALDLLDGHGGPADATAHLDLAQQRLREELRRIAN